MLPAQTGTVYDQRHRLLVSVAVDLHNNTIPASNVVQYVPVTLVKNGVTYIILYSMFATLLFVLLCAVLLKDGLSPQKRKLPVVWVLGLSMLGGLLGSTLNTVFWAYQLFGTASDGTMFRLWQSSTATLYIVPLMFHIAIQLRLMAFYPATLASRRKRIAISVVPTLMKVARLTTISISLHQSSVRYHHFGFGDAISQGTNGTTNLLTLIFQLVDTAYASTLLLWRYWSLGRRRDSNLVHRKSHFLVRWGKQTLFAMAFGFVLPTLYALALVLSSALGISAVNIGFMLVANVYVQAFGALLATLSSSYKWREDMFTDALAVDNGVLPGVGGSRRGSAATHAFAPDQTSNVCEIPSARPKFLPLPFSPFDSHSRSDLEVQSNGSSRGPRSPMHTASFVHSIPEQGGISPTDVSVMPIAEGSGSVTDDTDNATSLRYFSSAPLPQSETRRSSEATLFNAVALDKGDALTRKLSDSSTISDRKQPATRPFSAGTGRLNRMGSSRSELPPGGLEEEN